MARPVKYIIPAAAAKRAQLQPPKAGEIDDDILKTRQQLAATPRLRNASGVADTASQMPPRARTIRAIHHRRASQ